MSQYVTTLGKSRYKQIVVKLVWQQHRKPLQNDVFSVCLGSNWHLHKVGGYRQFKKSKQVTLDITGVAPAATELCQFLRQGRHGTSICLS